jgi:hypothetical protein
MSDELVEAAFLAGVPRWTDELAKAAREKKHVEAELLAWRLGSGFLKIAQLLQAKQEG